MYPTCWVWKGMGRGQWVESLIQPGPQSISNLQTKNFLLFSTLRSPLQLSRDHKMGQMTLGTIFPREKLTTPVGVALTELTLCPGGQRHKVLDLRGHSWGHSKDAQL